MTGGLEDMRQCKGANRSGAPVQRCKSERQRYIFRSRVSAIWSLVRVFRFGYRCGTWTCTCTRTP